MTTSLALVPMEDVDSWSYSTLPKIAAPVERLGINFAAPGSRRADSGTLWVPCTRGLQTPVAVSLQSPALTTFAWHGSRIEDDRWNWIAATGLDGVQKLSIQLLPAAAPAPRHYTVRMVFVEPRSLAPGMRVFDIGLQGIPVAKRFDIAAESTGRYDPVVRQWRGIAVNQHLEITFTPTADSPTPYGTISGIEIIAEEPE